MPEQNNKILKYISKNFLVIYAIIIIFALLFIIAYKKTYPKNIPELASTIFVSYSDPASHFSISMPPDWISSSDFGKQTTGIGTDHEVSNRTEVTNLSKGSVGINISIYETPPSCALALKPNTQIAGLPAYFDAHHYSWIINTIDSTIVLGYYYPGAGVYHRVRPGVAPASAMEMASNQKIINDIISSLNFHGAQALNCF